MNESSKWKYESPKKILLKPKKVLKIIDSKKGVVYDTRYRIEFDSLRLSGTVNVSRSAIKAKILEHDKKDLIVLIGNHPRTNMDIASWARVLGYKKIHLFDGHINDYINKML